MRELGDVLIFDRSSPWSQQLVRGLRTDGLKVAEGSGDLVQALVGPPAELRAVVVGEPAGELAAIDLLYEASQARTGGLHPVMVFLVTEVRKDLELLAHLRRRGVSEFLYRTAPVEKSVQVVRNTLYADRRAARRNAVSLPCQLGFQDREVSGMVEDISTGGARCFFRRLKRAWRPQAGDSVVLTVPSGNGGFEQKAEVRGVTVTSSFIWESVSVGLRFTHPPERIEQAVENLVDVGSSHGL